MTECSRDDPPLPRLINLQSGTHTTILSTPFVVGRSQDSDLTILDAKCSRRHFEVLGDPSVGYRIRGLSDNLILIDGIATKQDANLRHGNVIQIGGTRLAFASAESTDHAPTQCIESLSSPLDPVTKTIHLPLDMAIILGRDQAESSHVLGHLSVSRRHAMVLLSRGEVSIEDLSSHNGTYVNGVRISSSTQLAPGDRVSIGPYQFHLNGHELRPATEERVELACQNLGRTVTSNGLRLLDSVDLTLRGGEFTCILGPSGAGKSTLLRAISHREDSGGGLTRSGDVLLDGASLAEEFERLKSQIAFVPQHEIMFNALTLRRSLEFTAALRLPPDIRPAELSEKIDEVLSIVQLTQEKDTLLGRLSGGQRKRAALANELLADPEILFLDEVTSGLDELTDSEMMRLFRRITGQGMAVICITHSLAFVPRDCHRIVALTRFGRVAFDGDPKRALEYFDIDQLSEIYQPLYVDNQDAADELRQRFLDSCHHRERVPANRESRIGSESSGGIDQLLEARIAVRQAWVLTRRYCELLLADRTANVIRVIQCVLVAALLASLFGDLTGSPIDQGKCAFLMVVSCFWFGCNNSAKEIVKERNVFRQEHDASLRVGSYVWSKFIPLSVIAILQSSALFGIILLLSHMDGDALWWVAALSGVSITGVATGLAISARATSEEVAIGAVPLVLIPQIILAGSIAPLEGINDTVARIAVASYWGLEISGEILAGVELPSASLKTAFTVLTCHVVALILSVRVCLARSTRG